MDPFIEHIFAQAGTYSIRVGGCCAIEGGLITGAQYNSPYQLHVSLQNPGITSGVPEPGTWGMMLIGFGAVGFGMRRSRRSQNALPQIA